MTSGPLYLRCFGFVSYRAVPSPSPLTFTDLTIWLWQHLNGMQNFPIIENGFFRLLSIMRCAFTVAIIMMRNIVNRTLGYFLNAVLGRPAMNVLCRLHDSFWKCCCPGIQCVLYVIHTLQIAWSLPSAMHFVKRLYMGKGESSLAGHTRGFTNVIQRDEA